MKDADTKKHIPFIFEEAVAELRRDYPRETEDVAFINGNDPDGPAQIRQWCVDQKMPKMIWDRWMYNLVCQEETIAFKVGDKHLIALFPDNMSFFFQDAPDKGKFMALFHEAGHLIQPRGMEHDVDIKEISADSFAILRGISKGLWSKEDILEVSSVRSAGFMLGGHTSHLTSMSLDAIVINPKNIDYSALTPQQVTKLADHHASAFRHKNTVSNKLEAVADIGKGSDDTDADPIQERVEKRLTALTAICATANPLSTEFYVAARILKDAIEHNGFTYGRERMTVHIDGSSSRWQSVLDTINTRAKGRDIGAEKALQTPEFTRPEKPDAMTKIKRFFTPLKI
jgi:hypothetical protein